MTRRQRRAAERRALDTPEMVAIREKIAKDIFGETFIEAQRAIVKQMALDALKEHALRIEQEVFGPVSPATAGRSPSGPTPATGAPAEETESTQ